MKIKYAILFLFMGLLGQAQTLKFGVKVGANYSDPSSQTTKASAPLGYHIGGLAEFKFAKFAIQPELMYSRTSIKFNGNYIHSEVKIGYLTLPIVAKVTVLKHFSIDLGPHFSYAISESADSSIDLMANNMIVIPLADVIDINKFDYGITGGVTANLTKKIFFQLRAVYGFQDITKKGAITSSPFLNNATVNEQVNALIVKNRSLQLSVGYKF
jgi:opacity protein-like surface antigen